MTLAELADYVSEQTGLTAAEDLAFCKTALRRKHDELWQAGLWRDSLITATLSVTPSSDDLHAAGTVLLPSVIDHVCAVRSDERELRPDNAEIFYRTDFDQFENTGDPLQFYIENPVIGQWATARTIYTRPNEAGDQDAVFSYRYINGSDEVVEGSQKVGGIQELGYHGLPSVKILEELGKPETAGVVSVEYTIAGDDWLRWAAADNNPPKKCRIRLMQTPDTTDISIRVLGKRKPPKFIYDNDRPALRNVDNLLIDLVTPEMLKRMRQYGMAAAARAEAASTFQTYKSQEEVQQVNNARLIPDDGLSGYYYVSKDGTI